MVQLNNSDISASSDTSKSQEDLKHQNPKTQEEQKQILQVHNLNFTTTVAVRTQTASR